MKRFAVFFFIVLCVLHIIQGCKDAGTEIPVPAAPPVVQDDSSRFNRDVHPILLANCAISGCHSGSSPLAGFNQETYAGVRAGGATFGTNVIQPGDSSSSSSNNAVGSGIMKMVRNVNNQIMIRMPPQGTFSASGLPDSLIVKIGKWIKQGARNN